MTQLDIDRDITAHPTSVALLLGRNTDQLGIRNVQGAPRDLQQRAHVLVSPAEHRAAGSFRARIKFQGDDGVDPATLTLERRPIGRRRMGTHACLHVTTLPANADDIRRRAEVLLDALAELAETRATAA